MSAELTFINISTGELLDRRLILYRDPVCRVNLTQEPEDMVGKFVRKGLLKSVEPEYFPGLYFCPMCRSEVENREVVMLGSYKDSMFECMYCNFKFAVRIKNRMLSIK